MAPPQKALRRPTAGRLVAMPGATEAKRGWFEAGVVRRSPASGEAADQPSEGIERW